MKLKYINLLKQGYNSENTDFFSKHFDPSGSYTGNYLDLDDEYETPEQDSDDL